MLAAREGHDRCVNLLIENGANVRLKDKNGDTALNIANDNENTDIAVRLKRAGAKAEIKKAPPVTSVEDEDDADLGDDDSDADVEDLISNDDLDEEIDLEDDDL